MNERTVPPISTAAAAFLARVHRPFINGRFVDVASGDGLAVDDSATGETVARVPECGAAGVDEAVSAARAALEGAWGAMSPVERERRLLKLADAVEADIDLLGEIESIESGKSIAVAKALSAGGSANWLRYYAGWATKIEGATPDVSITVPPGARHQAMTILEPVGVVGAIVPWNFPLLIGIWKIAPALAAGCTIVLKPPQETPLALLRLAELIEQVGFPPGVINIVTGSGTITGEALIRHPGVDKLTFTGSTEVGRRVGHAAVDRIARFTLELGSKSPMILLSDMEDDIEPLLAGLGLFFNQGQVCTAAARILIESRSTIARCPGWPKSPTACRWAPGATRAPRSTRWFRPNIGRACWDISIAPSPRASSRSAANARFHIKATTLPRRSCTTCHAIARSHGTKCSARSFQQCRSETSTRPSGLPMTAATDSRHRSGRVTWERRCGQSMA